MTYYKNMGVILIMMGQGEAEPHSKFPIFSF